MTDALEAAHTYAAKGWGVKRCTMCNLDKPTRPHNRRCVECCNALSRDRRRALRQAPPARECAVCLVPFQPIRGNRRRYCSRICNDRAGQIRRYGITIEEFRALAEEQGGRCAICGDPPLGRHGLHIDHDHNSGRVRGLLCGWCNPGLGNFRDQSARLRAAADYIERHNG